MPPGQVSRGQEGTGLRFLTRSLRLWKKRDQDQDHSSADDDDSDSQSNDKGNSGNGNQSNGSGKSSSSGASSPTSSARSASSSAAGKSPFTSSGPPPPPPCFSPCVPDNDPGIVYSTSWSLSPLGFFQTSHQTDVVGSSLSFNFNGTGITVFGPIPASNATHAPPTAAYSIDAAAPVVTAEPMATDLVLNQPLFSASGLSAGAHTLVINVTDVQSASPFALQYFIVKPAAPPPAPSPSVSVIAPQKAIASDSPKSSSGLMVGVLAGVLGSVIFVLLCIIGFFIVIVRRRRRRALRSKDMQSSLFTTPESILMYSREPSSHYPASDSWLAKTRSIVGKSWVTNWGPESVSEKQ